MNSGEKLALVKLKKCQTEIEHYIISSCPTGEKRNLLTEVNLMIMMSIEEFEKDESGSVFEKILQMT